MKVSNSNCFVRYNIKLQKSLRDVESNFVSEMLRSIFENTVEGTSNKIYQSMMVDEYAKFIGPKTGIAERLACSLSKIKND